MGNVAPPRTWAMDVATMQTTTVPVVGTMETAAGRVTININSRTARNASAWIRRRCKIAKVTAQNQTTKVTATAMKATTTAVVHMTVVIVVARPSQVNTNSPIVKGKLVASAWTRLRVVANRRETAELIELTRFQEFVNVALKLS